MPTKGTLESFFKVTANKKKRTSDPEESEVLDLREAAPAASHEDATVKIVSKTLLGEVDKLLRLYLTLSVASATSERTFSSLCCLKTYLRSTMNQNHLNNCLLLHCHKSVTDTLNTVDIAKKFVRANEQRKRHFGKYQ